MDKNFKKKFLKGSAATSVGQASSMVFHFLSIMLLTRVIPKADFGMYALILVITHQFISFCGFGLETTLVKFISSDSKEENNNIFFNILKLRIFSTLFFVAVFYFTYQLFIPYFDVRIISYTIFIIFIFFFGSFTDLMYRVFQGLNLFWKYAIIQTSSAIIRVLLILFYFLNDTLDLTNLIFIEMYTVMITLAFQLALTPWKTLSGQDGKGASTKKIINFSIPIYFNNLFSSLYRRFNLIIIGAFLSPIEVAYYDIGNKIPFALRKMFNSFILVFFPNLSNLLSRGDKVSGEKLINNTLSIISLVLFSMVLIVYLFKSEIVTLVFSNQYADSALVFSLLMLNLALATISTVLGYSNLAAGYPKVPMKVNIFASIISLGGAFIMVPEFGFIGAAYSLLIMNIFSQILYLLYLNKINLNINVFKYSKPCFFLLLVIALFSIINLDSIIIRVATIILYLCLNWIFVPDFKSFVFSAVKLIPKFKS
jgi:O-antigen/teichoic acid export membrane protein